MLWYPVLIVLFVIFFVLAVVQGIRFWKEFKKLEVGKPFPREFVNKANRYLKMEAALIVMSCIFAIIAVLIKPQ